MESSTVSRQTMSRRPPVGRAPRPFQKPLRPRIATPATVTALNKNWPSHILTGIVRLVGPPLFHQRLEIRVALRRQHDADRDEEGAASLLGGEALAFEPERPAAAGPRRNGELDGPVERRYPHLDAERGFIKRHRQIEPDIVAVEREGVMWRDRHGDQEIAGAARASHALAAKPDLLAIGDPGGNLDFDVLARRQPHPLAHAVRRVRQRQSQGRRDISAGAEIVGLKRRAPAAARGAAERLAQNVLEAAKAGSATARRSAAPPPAAARPRRAPGVKPSGPKLNVSNSVSGPNPAPGRAPAPPRNPSNPWKRGLPSASISPRSNALRLSSSPRISYAALISAKRDAALGSFLLASGCNFFARRRKAPLMSAALALRSTPNTS